MAARNAPIQMQAATTGVALMDPTHEALIGVLQSIRDQADSVLRRIPHGVDQKSLAWKCVMCGRIKHFTRPAPPEVAAPCPKCGGEKFDPV